MDYIKSELSTSSIKMTDSLGNEKSFPTNVLIFQLDKLPFDFDARDVDEYLEGQMGRVIRRTGDINGVTMSGSELIIGIRNALDKETVKEVLNKLFNTDLQEVRKELNRL